MCTFGHIDECSFHGSVQISYIKGNWKKSHDWSSTLGQGGKGNAGI